MMIMALADTGAEWEKGLTALKAIAPAGYKINIF